MTAHSGKGPKKPKAFDAGKELRRMLRIDRDTYLNEQKQSGGTAAGYRERIKEKGDGYKDLLQEGLLISATAIWEEQPRRKGPDLFSIAGMAIPSRLTRLRIRPEDEEAESEEPGDEDKFEKVSTEFATAYDYEQDWIIHMRKSVEAAAAAAEQGRIVDEIRRRAKGKMDTPLRDIKD
jgi:hypothetical protein